MNRNLIQRNWRLAALWFPPLLFLALFYFYPLTSILGLSFRQGDAGLLGVWRDALASSSVWNVLDFTFWQATLSTILTLLAGLPAAYLFGRYRFPAKALLRAIFNVPFVLPTVVVAVAFNALLGPRGWLNLGLMEWLGLTSPPINFLNTFWAILVAHVFYNTSIVLRMVGDFWSRLDPRLTEAALVFGANRWQAFRYVTLPLSLPIIAAAAVLVFIFDFTSFGVVLLLGGPQFATLEVEIFYQTTGLFNLPLAAVLSAIQLLTTLLLTVLYARLSARASQPISIEIEEASQKPLSSRRARLLAGGLIAAMLLFFSSPLVALASRSLARLEPDRQQRSVERGLTLDFYRELGADRRASLFTVPPATAIAISLGYAAGTVVLALALGLPAAWALSRHKRAILTRLVDPLLMLPLGTSAVTLGLGFIIALDQPPLDLRASPLLIPIAHTLVALPFVVRSLVPALNSIEPELREIAATEGANAWQVVRYVDLPLVGRAVLVAATFAFTISLGEFGATAIIARPEFPTIPIAIFRLLGQPGALNYGQALALSTILMAVAAGGMLLIERVRIGESAEF
ncbi:MAG: iron ABC transporter permease [Chloroflexi bacterium]|nr:MAG: iron ABC transporter permease [Chloroflexota bacterium]MBL1194577.1 iron ABC transporter permease [Chloroflexota bacterium]NOH11866.1 iron ABC transporter permease [Chloroflexota bacterium]